MPQLAQRSGRRLLCVYQHAPTPGAPGIYRHRNLLAELVRRGWQVDLVSSPINYMTGQVGSRYRRKLHVRESIEGITHYWVWAVSDVHASRWRRALNYATFATSALVRGALLPRPDLIWASSPPLTVGTLGSALAFRFRRPWIFEVRDLWPESAVSVGWLGKDSLAYRMLLRLSKRYSTRAFAVTVPTPGVIDGVKSHGGKQIVWVSGVIQDNTPDESVRKAMRHDLGIDEKTCLFLYLGAHGVANGLDQIIDAAAVMADPGRAFFLFVGDGSDRARLIERVEKRNIPGVRMLGAVPKEKVKDYLAASDVCLHSMLPDPTFTGHLPARFMEFFGSHRPFVTTAAGLTERIAIESGGGFGGSGPALVDELNRWVEMSPEERAERGERSYRYGTERYGLKATVDKLEELFDRAIGGE